jgi:putative membrane protein
MPCMNEPKILAEATFNRKVLTYWLLSGCVLMVIAVVTIPLIPFWFIFGRMITGKLLEHMSCTLTERTLIVKKGWLNRVEKTVPLEKITDLGLKQGPIMRAMDLHMLTIETAGSSGAGGTSALVSIIGIEDTIDFRNKVLMQRDLRIDGPRTEPSTSQAVPAAGGEILADIRDTLHRIEQGMKES